MQILGFYNPCLTQPRIHCARVNLEKWFDEIQKTAPTSKVDMDNPLAQYFFEFIVLNERKGTVSIVNFAHIGQMFDCSNNAALLEAMRASREIRKCPVIVKSALSLAYHLIEKYGYWPEYNFEDESRWPTEDRLFSLLQNFRYLKHDNNELLINFCKKFHDPKLRELITHEVCALDVDYVRLFCWAAHDFYKKNSQHKINKFGGLAPGGGSMLKLSGSGRAMISALISTNSDYINPELLKIIDEQLKTQRIDFRCICVTIPLYYVSYFSSQDLKNPILDGVSWRIDGRALCVFLNHEHVETVATGWLDLTKHTPTVAGCYLVKNQFGQIRSMRFTPAGWSHPEFQAVYYRDLI